MTSIERLRMERDVLSERLELESLVPLAPYEAPVVGLVRQLMLTLAGLFEAQ